jgi:hypothetical protein
MEGVRERGKGERVGHSLIQAHNEEELHLHHGFPSL